MSIKKLGVILYSSFLIFATAPLASAQNTTSQDTTKKQTTSQKGTTTKDQSTQTDKSTTAKSKSQTTDKDKGTQSTTGEKKTKKGKTTKKSSSVSDEKVRHAQTALMNQGFDPGPIDGIMGPMTMTAIRNFQLHNHLQDTGTLTAETKNMLMSGASAGTRQGGQGGYGSTSSLNKSDQRSSLETSGVTSQGNLTSMEDIRQVQQSLTDLGYAPGDINGMMSSDTRTAVREFQWMNSLPVTGNVDPSTKMAIDSQAQGSVANAQLGQNTYQVPADNTYKQDTTSTTRTKPSGQDTYGTDTKHHATGNPIRMLPTALPKRQPYCRS